MPTMKTLKTLLVSTLCCLLLTCCDQERIVTAEQLPEAALNYLNEHYPDATILLVKKESELWHSTYEVHLSNNMQLEFDSDGTLTDM